MTALAGYHNGHSEISSISVPVPVGNPAPPVMSNVKSHRAVVTFKHINCQQRNGPFTTFSYTLTDIKYKSPVRQATSELSQFMLVGLVPYTNYTLTYSWHNQLGATQSSDTATFTTSKTSAFDQ